MSEKSILRPFKQVPVYQETEEFTITGIELKAMEDMSNAYSKFIPIFENILIRNLMNNKITIKYEEPDGTEIPKEEVLRMFEEFHKLNKPDEPVSSEPIL